MCQNDGLFSDYFRSQKIADFKEKFGPGKIQLVITKTNNAVVDIASSPRKLAQKVIYVRPLNMCAPARPDRRENEEEQKESRRLCRYTKNALHTVVEVVILYRSAVLWGFFAEVNYRFERFFSS